MCGFGEDGVPGDSVEVSFVEPVWSVPVWFGFKGGGCEEVSVVCCSSVDVFVFVFVFVHW